MTEINPRGKMTRTIALMMIALLLTLVFSMSLTVSAVSADSSLTVKGGYLETYVGPGETHIHTMIVSSGADSPTLDIQVEAVGFGNLASGAWTMVDPAEDISPSSARELIIDITPSSFTLQPGGSQQVEARIVIPDTFDDAARYAMVHFITQPLGQSGGTGMRAAVDVPIILKSKGVPILTEGQITEVQAGEVESGKPISINTTFKNTGNFHYRAKNEVVIFDEQGTELGKSSSSLTPLGIIPSYSVEIKTFHNLTGAGEIVEPGTYQIISTVILEDDTILDIATSTFTIDEPYGTIAGVDQSWMCIFEFIDEVPGPFECELAGVVLSFEGTGEATGEAIIGKYSEEPTSNTAFSADLEDGGMGLTPIKFVYVYVTGIDSGTAFILADYSDTELGEVEETSLLMALWNGEQWVPLNNLQVFTGANYITGEVPAAALTGIIIGLGGQGPGGGIGSIALWPALAAFIVVIIIVAAILYSRRRKRKKYG